MTDRKTIDRCPICSSPTRVVTRTAREPVFGCLTYVLKNGKRESARVLVTKTFTQCRRKTCGEEYYTMDQADNASRASMRAALRLYRKRLGYHKQWRTRAELKAR